MVHGIEYLEFPEFQRRMEDLVGLCLYQDYLRLLIFEDLVLLFNLDSLPCTYEYESQCDKKHIGDIQTCKVHLS